MTSRELVLSTLEFRNTEGRVPRQLWALPWANINHPEMMKKLDEDFVWDFSGVPAKYSQKTISKGNSSEPGEFVDPWGCTFENITRGIIGEVKNPLVQEDDWSDSYKIHIPEEQLSFEVSQINEGCKLKPEKFLMAGCNPRPFEQLQFIRGTVNLYMDLLDPPKKFLEFLEKMHDFYCRLVTKWAETDVCAIGMMDDWGSQNDLLINPQIWEELFMPMYRDYINIAHAHGKKMFMHSDGNTLRIIPKLIDLGLDAFNTQIFCIGVDKLKQFRGDITFWGEIDRQNLLPYGSLEDIDNAVQSVYDNLWQDGGCIAQCEFSIGSNPENVHRVYDKWASLRP